MSKRVMTAHGPGVVVATDDIRGRVQYQVEGEGFKVWVSAASVAEFGQVEWELDEENVDESNSTTLPYNPTPQNFPHSGESTIQPIHKLDIEKRTSPSDSLRFSNIEDLQERLGSKYASIPQDVDYGSLQARLDEDPYRLLSDFRQRAFERRAELDPMLGQQMDIEAVDSGLRTAAWADVRKKAVRLRRTGMVDMEAANPSAIVAMVTGDHGIYETIVVRGSVFTGSSAITEWSCSCPWGDWAFERQHTFVGRLCSHAYASLLELQALNKRKEKPEGWRNTASVHTAYDYGDYATDDYQGWCQKNGVDPWDSSNVQKMMNSADCPAEFDQNAADTVLDWIYEESEHYGARHPREDGKLSTEPGTLGFDERHIPYRRDKERVNVTAFIDEPAGGFGGTGQRDYIGTSAEELADENYEDIDGPDFNPAMQNANDVVVAHVPDNEDGELVDVMDPEDTVEAAFDEDGLTEDEVVARFQRSAGHIMSEGSTGGGGDFDISSAAQAHLRTAGRTFTFAEQQALIDEEPVGGPVDRSGLDLSGTHYLS